MKKIIILPLMVFSICSAAIETIPFGLRYINFLNQKPSNSADKQWAFLFAPTVKKIVNSTLVCNNRTQLTQQMIDVETSFGVINVELIDFIISDDERTHVVQFEITFKDQSTETVIAILKSDEQGLIKEINEVFGLKAAYNW